MNLVAEAAANFARWAFKVDPATWPHMWLVYLGAMVVVAVAVLTFVSLFAGPLSWLERRIAARIQSRVGPNRVGPQGFVQWIADGLKCFLKEDLVPDEADGVLFKLAPYLVFVGTFGAFLVLPFGVHVVAAQLDVGLLYVLAITSIVVVGLLMAGWGSNSKWALFGGVRSAAQLISYEVPAAFALLAVILQAGALSTQGIVGAQGGLPWDWFLFRNPFLFAAFFIYFTAAIAEGNRTPFDLPEAESELVSGYNIEYSGMRFLFFFFAEWANLWTMSAISTLAFLGGWQIPGVSPAEVAATTGATFVGLQLLSFLVFAVKASALVFIVVQLRWTLPRLRVDQLMIVCWKYLVPLAFACTGGVLLMLVLVPEHSLLDVLIRFSLLTFVAVVLVMYVQRIRSNYLADRDNYQKMEGKPLWYPPYRLP